MVDPNFASFQDMEKYEGSSVKKMIIDSATGH